MTRLLVVVASVCMVAVGTGGTVSAATTSCSLEAITPTVTSATAPAELRFTIRNPSGQTDPIRLVRIHSTDGGNGKFTYQGNNVVSSEWTTYDTGDGADIVAQSGHEIQPGNAYDFAMVYQAPDNNGDYGFLVTAGDNPSGGDIECVGSSGLGPSVTVQVTGGGTAPGTQDVTQRDIKIISFVLATGIAMWFLSFFRFRRAR